MNVVLDNRDLLLDGLWLTLRLLLVSGVLSVVLGTVLATCRVSPVAGVRAIGTSYVNLFRNTPLVVMFILVYFGLPELGIAPRDPFPRAIIALTVYHAAFVCEAVRSGVNAVPIGQAEAARAIGLSTGGSLRHVVLPQALRAAVVPIANVLIALTKNTSVVAGFAGLDLTYRMRGLLNDHPASRTAVFLSVAAAYIVIVLVFSLLARGLERWTARAAA